MKLHELKPASGARRKPTRVGRGIGSGYGKTSGRGHKGQKSRSGGGVRRGFEGGQMPLVRRVPKRGFTNNLRREPEIINIAELNRFQDGATVTPELLLEKGLISSLKNGVKILGNGELERVLTVKAHKFSKTAVAKIEAAGGKLEVV